MRKIVAFIIAMLIAVVPASSAFVHSNGVGAPVSDPTSLVLPSYDDAYSNWSVAGMTKQGGIPTSRVDCTTAQAGETLPLAPSGGDDATNINSAIVNCPANTVVELQSGTFNISSQTANHDVYIGRSNITLRGAGTCNNSTPPYCQTVILSSPGGATQTYKTGSSDCNSCAGFAAATVYISPANYLNGTSYDWNGCSWGATCNSSTYQLTANGVQGATTIQLNTVSGLSAGMWVRIDESDNVGTVTGPLGTNITAAPDILADSGSPATGKTVQADIVNGVEYGALYHRTTSEIKLISAVGGACGSTCVTFDSPMTINYRAGSPYYAQIYTPNHTFLTGVGLENLTIQGGVGGQTGGPLHMDFCAYCWLKNVETYYWVGGAGIVASARVEITGSYMHDCSDCENNGNEYPMALDGATTEALVHNNIFGLAGKGMVGRACGGGNVIAYNYVDRTFYQASSIGNYWLDMSLNNSHYVGCHQTLFEGNWANNCDNDNTHGNAVYMTYFRNWCTGLRSNFNDPSLANPSSSTYNASDAPVSDLSSISYASGQSYPYTPGQRHAAGAMMTDYWMSFVANVLGMPGVTCSTGCTMTGWVYSNAGASEGQKDKSIWETGWVGGGNPDPYLVSTSGYTSCNGSTPGTCAYFFRHGNYDTVTASIADYQTGYSTTMPNSFYLSSAPAYFSGGASCTYTWPWVTASSTTKIQSPGGGGSCSSYTGLPAKARFDAGTPFVQP